MSSPFLLMNDLPSEPVEDSIPSTVIEQPPPSPKAENSNVIKKRVKSIDGADIRSDITENTASNNNSGSSNTEEKSSKSLNLGSLLRLFKSEFFDSWLGISYLFRYPAPGVHDYLCNELYNMSDDAIEFYLAELCVMLIYCNFSSNALERFIMDKCKTSVHFALKVTWLLTAEMGEIPEVRRRCEILIEQCEMCVVNSNLEQNKSTLSSLLPQHCNESASDLSRMHTEGTLPMHGGSINTSSAGNLHASNSSVGGSGMHRRSQSMFNMQEDYIAEALEKQDRCEYFYKILEFVKKLETISDVLRLYPVQLRQQTLEDECTKYNTNFPVGIYLPLWEASTAHYCICRLVPEESKVLKSRERAPFILTFEVVEGTEPVSSRSIHRTAKACAKAIVEFAQLRGTTAIPAVIGLEEQVIQNLPVSNVIVVDDGVDHSNSVEQSVDASVVTAVSPPVVLAVVADPPQSDEDLSHKYAGSPFGEPFDMKIKRIAKTSPYGNLASWTLKSVIVKFGDDCRQEYLAMQLISQFYKIFTDASLPIYLCPYHILVTSTSSGLIELVSDAISIHQLKVFYQKLDNSNNVISLKEHFRRFYNGDDTPEYHNAVQKFVESVVGYSLVTFLLQIKDRHNGNILLDSSGRIVHIDFGFMLSNSPGGMNAENVPFKFPQEYVEVMGGINSEMYKYFKQLLLQGYMEVRKHCEKIILLVEMMAVGFKLPCYAAGQATVQHLRDRFNMNMTEKQVVEFLETALQQSHDNWRTRGYDRFQYYTNSILY